MKLKLTFLLFATITLSQNLYSQEDTISVFHKPAKNANQNTTSTSDQKYAVYANGSFIFRGGASIGAQAMLYKGLTVTFDYGKSKNDFLGKYDFLEDEIFGSSDIAHFERIGYTLGNIYEFGLKYYVKQEMNGTYLSVAYAQINNTAKYAFNTMYDNGALNIGINKFETKYTSNDYKFLMGASGSEDSDFFWDVCYGVKVRVLESNGYKEDIQYVPFNSLNNINYTQTVEVKKVIPNTKYRFGFCIGFKLGYKF